MDTPNGGYMHASTSKHSLHSSSEKPAKRTRVSAACAFCRQRKARCDGEKPCAHCVSSGKANECTYPPRHCKVEADYVAELEAKARHLAALEGHWPRVQAYGSPSPQFASGPLPPPPPSAMYRQPDPFHMRMHSPYTMPVPINRPKSGLDDLAAAAGSHETIPPHFHTKQEPQVLPLSIADPPIEDDDGMQTPSSRTSAEKAPEDRNRDGLTLIAETYPGGSSTMALAGRVQNAANQLVGGTVKAEGAASDVPKDAEAVSPYRVTDNRFIFHHSAAPHELYVLPTRKIADQLLELYRTHIHLVLPIFHWPTFQAQYDAVWTADAIDTDTLGLLNLIFANAALICPPGILPGKEYEASMRFYRRALKLMYPLVLAAESIISLTCLVLMTHYLIFSPEVQLCWTTCGNALRIAQCRGFHVPSTTESMSPVDREVRRRIWNACVQLDVSICVTIGFASGISPAEIVGVECALVDDDYLDEHGVHQPDDRQSTLAFFVETSRMYSIQAEVVQKLFTSRDTSTSTAKPPDTQTILALDRKLADWKRSLPVHLTMTAAGARARADRPEFETQAVLLDARTHALKCLIHRPLLFYLCQRSATEGSFPEPGARTCPLDARLAKSSAQLCAEAAVDLVEQCLDGWKRAGVLCWAHQLYYIHSAALVLLAAKIVDENERRRGNTGARPVADPRTEATLGRTLEFFDVMAGEGGVGVVPAAVTTGPARRTARRCRSVISRLCEALSLAVTVPRHAQHASPNSSAPSQSAPDDQYEHYAKAFFELVPNAQNGAPSSYENGLGVDPSHNLMGQWSMHDLLSANCLPAQHTINDVGLGYSGPDMSDPAYDAGMPVWRPPSVSEYAGPAAMYPYDRPIIGNHLGRSM